jgi:hypothetical protein
MRVAAVVCRWILLSVTRKRWCERPRGASCRSEARTAGSTITSGWKPRGSGTTRFSSATAAEPCRPTPSRSGIGCVTPFASPKSSTVRLSAFAKRQVVGSFQARERSGAYWGIRTDIGRYGFAEALPCPADSVQRLADTPTRLERSTAFAGSLLPSGARGQRHATTAPAHARDEARAGVHAKSPVGVGDDERLTRARVPSRLSVESLDVDRRRRRDEQAIRSRRCANAADNGCGAQ